MLRVVSRRGALRLAAQRPAATTAAAQGATRAVHQDAARAEAAQPQGGRVLVTTPIFYVNGQPHIGHAYSGLLCDALARWLRIRGEQVLFSTGTDEHGAKVEQAARDAGASSVLEFCDGISGRFKELFQRLDCTNDAFIRTTDARHKETVAALWERLERAGYIVEGNHAGWYCQSDEAFLTDKQVVERDGKRVSAESGHPVEWLEESNYVFRLPALQDEVIAWLNTPGALQPTVRRNEIISFLQHNEMRELSVSRPSSRVAWAIPVPENPDQAIYVWLDALTNYLTVAGVRVDPDPSVPVSWWDAGVAKVYHVVGKDIIRFHTVFWPAFLLAAGIEAPNHVIAHAHWTVEGTKMSKSLGNVICPFDLLDEYELDAVRYFLLRHGGLTDDNDYSPAALETRRKDELANTYGNLLGRSLVKSITPEDSWPGAAANMDPAESPLAQKALVGLADKVNGHFENLEFARGTDAIMAALYEANRVFTNTEPWVARKKLKQGGLSPAEEQAMLGEVSTNMFWILETLRISSILLQPLIPDAAGRALDALGIPPEERTYAAARAFTTSEQAAARAYLRPKKGAIVLFPRRDD